MERPRMSRMPLVMIACDPRTIIRIPPTTISNMIAWAPRETKMMPMIIIRMPTRAECTRDLDASSSSLTTSSLSMRSDEGRGINNVM